jgi:hypothetical protein
MFVTPRAHQAREPWVRNVIGGWSWCVPVIAGRRGPSPAAAPTRRAYRHRLHPLVLAVLVTVALASCGGGTSESTSTSRSGATSQHPATQGSSTSSVAPPPAATTTPGAGQSAARPTIADLERDLAAAIVARYPLVGPGKAACRATGSLVDWQALLCAYHPDEPAEFGLVHVAVFDRHRYAWVTSPCCGAGPALGTIRPACNVGTC